LYFLTTQQQYVEEATSPHTQRRKTKCEIKSNEIRERTLLRRFAGHNSKKDTTF